MPQIWYPGHRTMRKLLDWIADKLGYQRKCKARKWPPIHVTADFLEDDCLPPNLLHDYIAGTWVSDSDAPAPIIKTELKDGII
ncbi:hypothetical protein LCGC14_2768180 [marine sediment metagenome]|uniref:Uncharacterized protein n=1 Tax=marine sediment metagenome TaxID=412755 RepID=A0A0F9B5Q8_9ZZZZ